MAVRKRATGVVQQARDENDAAVLRDVDGANESRLLDASPSPASMSNTHLLLRQPVWIVLAVASGACAAANGVFAKLTTTALTSTLADHISRLLHLKDNPKVVEYTIRASFFGLNLLFNALMWGLFTAALARGDSTTRVSIVNVSANFLVTAVLGWLIFSESLPWLWWVGAALLAAGNVVIGSRGEASKPGGTIGLDESREEAEGLMDETNLIELDEGMVVSQRDIEEQQRRLRKGEDVDAPI